MSHDINDLGQPVGVPVDLDLPRPRPPRTAMTGRTVRVEPLTLDHAPDLFDAFAEDRDGRIWTYLPNGPYRDAATFATWVRVAAAAKDPLMHALVVDGRALGHASFLRIAPDAATIEVGFINFAPALQRSIAATEAMYLMMARAFDDLGYRRYEWKCNALNAASCRAAERLGFTFEGIFRQAALVKGRNRDTAWYSVLDGEWPRVKAAFETWLAPENFDDRGQQIRSLTDIRADL
ncbi:MAG: GNAT family N-acetyltransferase [Marinibacterium sp.]